MTFYPRIAHLIALAVVAATPSLAQLNAAPGQVAPQKITVDVGAAISNAADQSSQAATLLSQQFVGASAALKARYDRQVQASPAQASTIRQQQMNEYATLQAGYMKRMDTLRQQLNDLKTRTLESARKQIETAQQQASGGSQQSSSNVFSDVAAAFDALQQRVEVIQSRALAEGKANAS